jgi:predicted dehydrogenase
VSEQIKKLRWGILGAARMTEVMLPAIVEASNAQLVAVASRRSGAAAEVLTKCGVDQNGINTYDDPDQLLDDPEVDVVYLPMANEEHAEWAVRAIEHKKHVLCEKPMALKVADIDAIETAAKQHGVTVMEGFMYRLHPQHERVRQIINSDAIGDIRTVRSCFSFLMAPARKYRISRNIEQGGGAMWDIGCYAIHTCRMFFQELPSSVIATYKTIDSGADVSNIGILDYGDGRYAQFDFSFERARRAEYEIIGTKGGIKCHNVWSKAGDTPVISWWNEAGEQHEEQLPSANHFRLEIEHFTDCVLNNSAPILSLQDARQNCQTVVAALQSAQQGQSVTIPTS